jgi:integrase-like protein/helix-turn-helix protein
MSANQAVFPIAVMARVLGVSTAGYYAWRRREPSARGKADAALLKRIRTAHAVSAGTYGAPRIHAELKAEGEAVGRKRIARLMRATGLSGVSRRRGIVTTRRDSDARPAPDLVDRNFVAAGADQLWVADITYVPTLTGFLYLAVVLDAFSRRIVGWAMAGHLRTELVLDALDMALGQRQPRDVVHHSDQGSQYTPSVPAAARPACAHRWARSAMPTTMPCARVSSPPWNANSWTAGASTPGPRRAWRSLASSRAGTIRAGAIPPSATSRPSILRRRKRRRPRRPARHRTDRHRFPSRRRRQGRACGAPLRGLRSLTATPARKWAYDRFDAGLRARPNPSPKPSTKPGQVQFRCGPPFGQCFAS